MSYHFLTSRGWWPFAAFVLCIVFLNQARTASSKEKASWSQPERCGVNSLYAMLRLKGVRVEYSELVGVVGGAASRETTIQELADASAKCGMELQVRRVIPTDVVHIPMPFVMHIDQTSEGGSGHFVLVYAVVSDNDGKYLLRYVDGTVCLPKFAFLDGMLPNITGYVLVDPSEQPLSSGGAKWLVVFALGVVVLLAVTLWGMKHYNLPH